MLRIDLPGGSFYMCSVMCIFLTCYTPIASAASFIA